MYWILVIPRNNYYSEKYSAGFIIDEHETVPYRVLLYPELCTATGVEPQRL